MKSYGIFIKKNKNNESIDEVILVKEGFNVYALFFNILWFLFNKMWICAAVVTVVTCLVLYIFCYSVAIPVILLIMIFIGFEANNLLIKKYQTNSYYFVGYSSGNDEKEAKLRFLDSINQKNKNRNKVIY